MSSALIFARSNSFSLEASTRSHVELLYTDADLATARVAAAGAAPALAVSLSAFFWLSSASFWSWGVWIVTSPPERSIWLYMPSARLATSRQVFSSVGLGLPQ